jgi:hypothetical protein
VAARVELIESETDVLRAENAFLRALLAKTDRPREDNSAGDSNHADRVKAELGFHDYGRPGSRGHLRTFSEDPKLTRLRNLIHGAIRLRESADQLIARLTEQLHESAPSEADTSAESVAQPRKNPYP